MWLFGNYLAWLNSPHHICQVTGSVLSPVSSLHCSMIKCHWTAEFYERPETKGNYALHKQAVVCLSRSSRLYDLVYTIHCKYQTSQLCLWSRLTLGKTQLEVPIMFRLLLSPSDIQLSIFHSLIHFYISIIFLKMVICHSNILSSWSSFCFYQSFIE